MFCPGHPPGWPGPHKDNVHTPLTREVGRFVKPVYVRLGDEILLRRCLRGKTQNPNESLHSVIWRKCLKTDFLGKLRVEAGTAIAVSKFNQGTEKSVSETTIAFGFQLKCKRSSTEVQEKRNRERRRLHRIRQHMPPESSRDSWRKQMALFRANKTNGSFQSQQHKRLFSEPTTLGEEFAIPLYLCCTFYPQTVFYYFTNE